MPIDTRLTYQDLCELPYDGKRYEIIQGDLIVTGAPLFCTRGLSLDCRIIS